MRLARWFPCAMVLVALTGPAPSARADVPALLAPACTLEPRAAEQVTAALGYADDHWTARSGARVGDIRVEAGALHFVAATGGPAVLVATHLRNVPSTAPVSAYTGTTLAVFAANGQGPEWLAAASEVGERLEGLPWRCALVAEPPLHPAAPWLAWGLLLAAAGLATRAAAERLARLSRREVLALLILLTVSLALRGARWSPFPMHYIEVERVPPSPKAGSEALASLAAPLLSLTSDGVAAQAGLNVALGALAPLLLVALGTAWRSRSVGWLAGLLLATAPLQLRFGGCSDASVAFTTVLLGAVLTTELALSSKRRDEMLAAGLAWGLALPVRPDAPIYLVALGAWLLSDARGRALLTTPGRAALLVGPVVAGLAVAIPSVLARGSAAGDAVVLGSVTSVGALALDAIRDLTFDPRLRPPLEGVLAIGGALLVRGPTRLFAVLAGLVLPGVAFSLQGSAPFGGSPLDLEEAKSALYGQPFWLLAAASLLAMPLQLPIRWRRRLVPVSAAALIAMFVSAWLVRDTITRPSPVQAEHAFLAARLPALPARAVIVIEGTSRGYNAPVHVEHRVLQAGRALVSSPARLATDEGLAVVAAGADLSGTPADVPLLSLRGWLAFLDPHPHTAAPPTGACAGEPGRCPPQTGASGMIPSLTPLPAERSQPVPATDAR